MTTQFSTTYGVHLDQHKTLGFVAFLDDVHKMRESQLSDVRKQTRYFKQKFEKEQADRSESSEKNQRHFHRVKAGMDFPRASSQEKKTQANVTTTDSRPDHFKKEFEMEKGKCLKSNNDIQKRIECLTDENKALCTQLAEQQTIFKEKESQLQKALEDMKFSHQELNKTYNTDILNSKITASNLDNELKKERHAHHVTKTQLEHISSETNKKFKQNETRLQKDLDCMKELRDKFESELLSAKQQIQTFEDKLHLEVQAKIQTKEMNDKLKAEKDDLQLRFNKEMSLLQENFDKKETELKNALEKVEVLYQELNKKYNEDVLTSKRTTEQLEIELKKERRDHQVTKTQLKHISSEIDKFKHNETRLQKELDCMKVANQQLRDTSEAEILSAKQQIQTFEDKLHLEIQAHSETKIQTKEIIEKLRAEKDALQIRADGQISLLQENVDEKETELQNALENVRELNNKYNDVLITKQKADHLDQEQKKEMTAHPHSETDIENNGREMGKQFKTSKHDETQFQEDLDEWKVSYAPSDASDINKRLAKEPQMEICEKPEIQAEENPVVFLTKMSTLLNQSSLDAPSQVPGAIATQPSVITSVTATRSQDSFFYGNQRNKQCLPNSLVFLSFLHENENISSSDLDLVLDRGDRMYSQVRLAHPARDHLATDELPTEVKARVSLYHVKMNFANSKCGVFLSGDLPNLSQGLQCLTSDVQYALMVMGSSCIAIFRTQSGEFGYFDPHPRNTHGDPAGDYAVMLKFTCLTDMIDRITSVFTRIGVSPSSYYEIQPVEF
ncbi:uncharacterized protein [Nothobranchius furzeri]|uniref:uncharacterized protein n=1 Tax=Nothobranchius furzeri TaxID=105023 RepID=UPI003904BDD0